MDVKEYTVSDANGEIDDVSIKGTIKEVSGNPFAFYVKNTGSTTKRSLEVKIVMPLGGTESGLFRFPRVGEKVLVGIASNANYLMGYIPTYSEGNDQTDPKTQSSQDFQTAGMFQDNGRGEVFRYQQTGKKGSVITASTPNQERYSEIGFYHRKTQWKPSEANTGNYQDTKDNGYPKIDQINIQSTGDIHESAANHHRMKAKRIEILSDVNETDFSKELKDGNRPFGDRPGDDSNLYAGDVHVRAGNRIVIKAGQEIRLQVGRSAIVISDDGITICSRKTHANLATGWDSAISLTARSGLSMFGQHVSIGAAYDFSISEAWGGSLKSIAGVVRLSGKDIKALAFSTKAYLGKTLAASTQAFDTLGAMIAGMVGGDQESGFVNQLPALVSQTTGVAALLVNFLADFSKSTSPVTDPLGSLAMAIGVIQQLIQVIVYTVLDFTIPEKNKDAGGRDGLNMAAMVAEYGLMTPLFGYIFYTSAFKPIHTSYLHLTKDAQAVFGGFNTKIYHTVGSIMAGPVVGMDPAPPAVEETPWTTIMKKVAVMGPVATVVAHGTYFIDPDKKAREKLLEL